MSTNTITLQKKIKFRQLFAIGFGTIIGTGWILVAGHWITTAGPGGAMVAFAVGALFIICLGLGYGEMGAAFPHSGGEVVYAYEGFGPLGGFVAGWILALVYVSTCAFEAVAAAWILSVLFPGFTGPVLYSVMGSDITLTALVVSAGGVGAITWINFRGGASAASFQELTMWLLVAASLFFIAAALIKGTPDYRQPWFERDATGSWLSPFLMIFATVPLWYSGFNTLPQALGEVGETKHLRYFVSIMALSVLAGLLFYSGVILATASALPRSQMNSGELVVAEALFAAFDSRWPGNVVLISGLLGIITTWNAVFFSAARILFAMGRARLLPGYFAQVHEKYGSPSVATLTVGALAFLAALLGRASLLPIINLVGFLFTAIYLLISVTVFRLRVTQPDLSRPYRVPGHPWFTGASILVALAFVILAGKGVWESADGIPAEMWVLLLWTALGAVMWQASSTSRRKISDTERRSLILLR